MAFLVKLNDGLGGCFERDWAWYSRMKGGLVAFIKSIRAPYLEEMRRYTSSIWTDSIGISRSIRWGLRRSSPAMHEVSDVEVRAPGELSWLLSLPVSGGPPRGQGSCRVAIGLRKKT